MVPIDEKELIRRALNGDSDAFEGLYKTHLPRTSAIVSTHVWNRDDVEDLVQTTFMHAYLGLERFRGDAAFSTWLTQIALNVCATHRRTLELRRNCLNRVADPVSDLWEVWAPAGPPDPEEALHRKEWHALLMRTVDGLPPACVEAAQMRFLEDCSYVKITQALQTPMGTVKTWLHRARERLKQTLGPTEGG